MAATGDRFVKRIPRSALGPIYKLSLPHKFVIANMPELMDGRNFDLASCVDTTTVWQASITPRRNRERHEFCLRGWKLFAQAHEVRPCDQYTFHMVSPNRLVASLLVRDHAEDSIRQQRQIRRRGPPSPSTPSPESSCIQTESDSSAISTRARAAALRRVPAAARTGHVLTGTVLPKLEDRCTPQLSTPDITHAFAGQSPGGWPTPAAEASFAVPVHQLQVPTMDEGGLGGGLPFAGLDLLPLSDPMHLRMAESLGGSSCSTNLTGSPASLQLAHAMQTHNSLVPLLTPASLALGPGGPSRKRTAATTWVDNTGASPHAATSPGSRRRLLEQLSPVPMASQASPGASEAPVGLKYLQDTVRSLQNSLGWHQLQAAHAEEGQATLRLLLAESSECLRTTQLASFLLDGLAGELEAHSVMAPAALQGALQATLAEMRSINNTTRADVDAFLARASALLPQQASQASM